MFTFKYPEQTLVGIYKFCSIKSAKIYFQTHYFDLLGHVYFVAGGQNFHGVEIHHLRLTEAKIN